jgi:hypothetical protein
VPVFAYTVAMVRFGNERLLSVRREPAEDAGADVSSLLNSTPQRTEQEDAPAEPT